MRPLIVIVFCLVSVMANAQKIDAGDFYGTWQLDKYSDDEEYYQPPKKEVGDYITLNQDMTFITVSEGEKTKGTWVFNTNGQYIEFREESGNREKIFIHFLSQKSMVATYDTDEYRVWEVHFIKNNK